MSNLKPNQFDEAVYLSKSSDRERLIRDWTLLVDTALTDWMAEVWRIWISSGLEAYLIAEYQEYLQWSPLIPSEAERRRIVNGILENDLRSFTFPEPTEVYLVLRRLNVSAYNQGAESALRSMGFIAKATEVSFTLTNEEILNQLDNRAREIAGTTSDGLITSAHQKMTTEIFIKGGTVNNVIRQMESQGVPQWKAKQVTETELQIALGSARHDMFQRSGVQRKRWISVGDRRVREQHRLNERQGWIPITQVYQNGARHPGDGPSAINCRCVEEADLSDPSIILQPWDGS